MGSPAATGDGGACPAREEKPPTNAKEKRRRNLRVKKRSRDSDDSGDDRQDAGRATLALSQNPKGKGSAMMFTTKNTGDDEKKGFHTFESSGMEASVRADDATRTVEDMGVRRLGGASQSRMDDQFLKDHQHDDSIMPRREEDTVTKTYRGIQGYTDYRQNFRAEAERAGANISERKQQAGPARPSSNYRMTVLVDYQPDVCKDYKETGFCGFGDSCKFLHDRSDYKAGWELDRDWNDAQKAKKEREERLLLGEDVDTDEQRRCGNEESLPFACLICKEPWGSCADPVVTKCGHYFCETCALKQNAKTGKCFACGKSTQGIFNTVTLGKLKK